MNSISAPDDTYPPMKKPKLIADTGSFGHYLNPDDAKYLVRIEDDTSVTVSLPNETTMTSSLTGALNIDTIPMEARKAHVFNELTSWSLLSLGVLCDAGCTANFSSDKLTVKIFDKVVLNGYRDHTTHGMWMVDLTQENQTANSTLPTKEMANVVYPTGTIAKLVAFYHGCACSTPVSSFLKILELGTALPGITKKDTQISTNIGGDSERSPRRNKVCPIPTQLQAVVVNIRGLRG